MMQNVWPRMLRYCSIFEREVIRVVPQGREVTYSPTLLSTSLRVEPGAITFDLPI